MGVAGVAVAVVCRITGRAVSRLTWHVAMILNRELHALIEVRNEF